MRFLASILLALAVIFVAAWTVPSKDHAQRVMTFNIRYNEPKDGVNAWPNRKEKVAGLIRFHKADLIGVQEALHGQMQDLQTLMPQFGWVGVGRADGNQGGEYSGIFYRKNRFKLIAGSTFWLSPTPDVVGSKGWDANLPRIVTWAKFKDTTTGKTFVHFNTHFDHIGRVARAESAKLLLSQVQKIAGKIPYVITGDFNAVESDEPYQILTGKKDAGNFKLTDARYVSVNPPYGPTSTFNAFGPLQVGKTIDHIFVSPASRVIEHAVLADQYANGLWPSDHLPVMVEVFLK